MACFDSCEIDKYDSNIFSGGKLRLAGDHSLQGTSFISEPITLVFPTLPGCGCIATEMEMEILAAVRRYILQHSVR